MKRDIVDRGDIEKVVNLFYNKVRQDEVISHFFSEVIKIDWDKHLPLMYCFWENALFYTGNYTGNPMAKHMDLHKHKALNIKDFVRWTKLFNEAVDEQFEGEHAEQIKQRASSISAVMQIKLFKN